MCNRLTKDFLAIVIVALGLPWGYRLAKAAPSHTGACLLGFGLTFAIVLGAWASRNAISVGKFGLTEEYGAVALIERFAYDDMTLREGLQAFPYCLPGVGDIAFDRVYGTDAMHRFVYHTPGGFFHAGRGQRETLLAQHERLAREGPVRGASHPTAGPDEALSVGLDLRRQPVGSGHGADEGE